MYSRSFFFFNRDMVHAFFFFFFLSGHGTCTFSHDSWIMIYTPNDFCSEVCLFKSTHFYWASPVWTMVDVHSNSANRYVWWGITYVSFEMRTCCFSSIYMAMQKGNNASLFAVPVWPKLWTAQFCAKDQPSISSIWLNRPPLDQLNLFK